MKYESTSFNKENITRKQIGYLREIWHFIKPFWKRGLLASGLIIITSLLSIPQPLFLKFILDDVIINKNPELLSLLLLLLVGLILIEAFIKLFQQYVSFTFEQKIILSIQHKLFNQVIRLPKSFFDNQHTGYLMSRIVGDVFQLRILFSSTIIQLITNSIKFLGVVVVLFFLQWKLTLISLSVLPFYIAAVKIFGKKSRIISYKGMEKRALISRYINESISGLELVKTFAAEEKETQKIFITFKDYMNVSVEQNIISTFSQFFIGLISSIGALFILWFGAREIIANNLTIGSFVAFNSYLGYIYRPARFLAQTTVSHIQSSFAALERVFSLFDLVSEEKYDNEKIKISRLSGSVIFSQVSFAYNHEFTLKNINFSVEQGEMVAIVGPTGAGKSTLIKLLLSLYRPQEGSILFDGIEINEINVQSLRKRIGVVSQETFLFDDTIANNIRYGKPEAVEREIIEVARASMAHEFITSFSLGYDTRIGERGIKLSTGQKQRISIARALLKDPDILVFDEPTSALDAITEKAIKDIIFDKMYGKTIFIIAHRLSTIKSSDRIIVLDDGKICGIGSHEELFKNNNLYMKMCKEQALFT